MLLTARPCAYAHAVLPRRAGGTSAHQLAGRGDLTPRATLPPPLLVLQVQGGVEIMWVPYMTCDDTEGPTRNCAQCNDYFTK